MRSWQKDALAYARDQAPREMCGLVVDHRFVACRNIHGNPRHHFEIAPADYLAAAETGTVQALVHSHVNVSANPSAEDRVHCEASALPWYIVGLPSGTWVECHPRGYTLPLLERPFIHGAIDCWACTRDALAAYFGVEVQDFRRTDGWWHPDRAEDLYRANYARAGFVQEVDPDALQPGDMIVMALASPKPCHSGLYLGDGRMIHHPPGGLSTITPYGGYWRDITVECMRHRELIDA
tara:strand:- start:265 stop:975 length:711 start_codon:yes stop_codon:yes gene_type:complete